ncbi:DUF6461 domain-containing protein [Streptomyces sp. RB17]|uniref:DUF6461 domain-containing protein n=1 Tax=Streptomyces sp. RB17 TaxID=2585197 RepID=UPI001296A92F|nr:DUF6461 domain-containing protein [Streptomyces sp. RB17]
MVFAVRVGVLVCEGIGWLADGDEGLDSVVFARDISPEDLAVRMGGTPGAAVQLTGPDVTSLLHRSETGDSDVVRVAACGAWSYAVLHLADPGRDDLAVRASRGGVEVIQYVAMTDHPPAQFDYLRDGRTVCGFGIGEEAHRWGQDPDHLLPALVAGGVLTPDGTSHQAAARPGSAMSGNRLTLTVLEHHFGLCLPQSSVMRAPLPAYTVRGTLSLGPDPDVDIIRTWAAEHGYSLNWGGSGHVPTSIRDAYAHATR